jgi:H+/Cl- antiporter ClcA
VRADGPLAAWQREIAEARTKYTACPECSQWTPVGRCTWCGTDTEDPATRKHHGDQRKFARVRSQVRLAPLYSAVRGLTKWDLREHGVLLGGLAKWIALGSLVGAVAGSASAFFLWSLDLVTRTRQSHVNLIWFLPLAGLLVGFLYSRFGENVSGGNNLILDELHQGGGRVPLRMAPFVLGGTLVTHLFGGSAGREGTAVQMGGSLADWLGRLFRLGPDDRRILLTSGVAGGFGSVFGTPLAGTVFGMEVTQVGGLKYESLVAAFAASMVGDLVTRAWGISHTLYPTIARLEPTFALLGKVAVLGVAAGLVSRLFAELGHTIRAAFKTMVPWELLRPVIGGAIVVVAVFGFHAFDYIGLGTPMILRSFTPGAVPYLAFLWKLLLTTITLGAGFQGGEVTPLFFIGATLGHALGQLLGLPVELAAAAGFVAVFAGAANTPLACIVMGAELFGSGGLPYLGLASILAYVSSGHAGIYTAQRVLYPKSNALPVPAHTTLRALHHGRTPILPALAAEGEEQTVTD